MPKSIDSSIVLDVTRLLWRAWSDHLPTGIDRTCLEYLAHFRNGAFASVQCGPLTRTLTLATSQRLFEDLLDARRRRSRRRLLADVIGGAFPQAAAGDLEDVLYLNIGHTGLHRPSHHQWVVRNRLRAIYFVHDLIPITHPEYCRPGESDKHRARLISSALKGAGIIVNSQDTLNNLASFAGSHSLSLPPALVAQLGFPELSAGDEIQHLSRPYFVMLGTVEGRKNHLLILQIWADLARRLGAACPQLIIIGQRGWECEQVIDMLERCDVIRDHVVELSRCDDATLNRYMRGARALLFPSFVEGYGLPLIEALAVGVPVIASSLPVFRELGGDVPDYLSPIDGAGWMSAIEDYACEASAKRSSQLERLTHWKAPTWASHFERLDEWLGQFRA